MCEEVYMSNEEYEVGVKVELTASVWATLDRRLTEIGAALSDVTLETYDAYLFAVPVTIDGRIDYSFVRLRLDRTINRHNGAVGAVHDITTKEWVLTSGVWTRAEAKAKHTAAQHYELYSGGSWPTRPRREINKKRDEYRLQTSGLGLDERDVTIALDQVTFARGGSARFFIEAEVVTENKDEVPALEQELLRVLSGILNIKVEEIVKSPSYLALAMEGK